MTALDPIRPHLRWFVIGFCLAGAGVGLGFLGEGVQAHAIAVAGFGVTVSLVWRWASSQSFLVSRGLSASSSRRGATHHPVQGRLPNMRLKLSALLLKEVLCCLLFEMSAAA